MEQRKSRKKSKNKLFKYLVTLLCVMFVIVVGMFLYNRYSFTKERVNLNEYIGATENNIAIYVNNVLEKDKGDGSKYQGLCVNNAAYLSMSWVKKNLNDRFYYAKDLNKILYCTVEDVKSYGENDIHQVGYSQYVIFKDEPYLLIEFVSDYTNIRFDKHLDSENKRIYIYNDWNKEKIAYLKTKEAARVKGGNKSPIVVDCRKGEEVVVLDEMVKWSKVKTSTGFIGYVRNTKLENPTFVTPSTNFVELKKEKIGINEKVVLGFHQVFSNYKASQLNDLLKNTKGMNVISPTWYAIKNDDGEIRSLANLEYVKYCHKRGLKVWPTVNNFDLGDFDDKKIFSSSFTRKKMIEKILREINVCELDGINLDIEGLKVDEGEDYIQFVRELSIELTKIKKTLSVDTYIPISINNHYNIAELGKFCDYVVVMCYDEHYSGSKEAGSVSSISFVRKGIELSLEKIDKDTLVVALPFYTRIWETTAEGAVSSKAYPSMTAETESKRKGIKFSFDDVTGQNYGSITNSSGTKIECWLEDDVSLQVKMSEVLKENVGGVAAWKLAFEREGFFDILNMNNY